MSFVSSMGGICSGSGSDAEMMDLDGGRQPTAECNKRNHHAMQLQTATSGFIGRSFRISPTTVLDTNSDNDVIGNADAGKIDTSSEDAASSHKRRKTPEDAPLLITLSSAEVISTIVHRFRMDGTSITKVTEGTYRRGDPSGVFFGSLTAYVSVHFCSPDGKYGELRTTDGTRAMHLIGEAALPSIQAHLRTAR